MRLSGVRNRLGTFIRDERGVSAIEYGLIAGALSIAIASVVYQIGSAVQGDFQDVNDGFNSMH